MPAELKVRRNFNHQDGIDTEVDFHGTGNEAGRAAFGVAVPERLSGDVGVVGVYQDFGASESLKLQLDLTQATLKLSELAYAKPEGHAASAALSIDLRDSVVYHIGDIRLKARGLDIRGAADLDPATGQLQRLALDRLQVDKTDVVVGIVERPNGDTVMKNHRPGAGCGTADQ